MIEEVLQYLNNYFLQEIYSGEYSISQDGKITLSFLQNGQYFRIVGSILNDGIYQYTDDLTLKEETFNGEIWALAIPNMLVDLIGEIKEWQKKYGDTVSGPYSSESFGGYSYSKGSGSSGESLSWQDAFKARLAPYRRLKGCDYAQPAYQSPDYQRPYNPDHPYGV